MFPIDAAGRQLLAVHETDSRRHDAEHTGKYIIFSEIIQQICPTRSRLADPQNVFRTVQIWTVCLANLTPPRILVVEARRMKVLGIISTTAVFLLLGSTAPAFAQEDHQQESAKPAQHEEQAKPAAKQEQAKPQKQEQQQAKSQQEKEKQQQQSKSSKQEQQQAAKGEQQEKQQQQVKGQQKQETKQQEVKTQQNEEKGQQHQQQANGQAQQSQGQYARNGQKDSYGHVYNESHFGPNHHARFEENGGRYYNGRREYSYGGYWFYAGVYPPWFYQQDVYFIMGADGLWYAVAAGNPSLTFQVNIG
jgi:hypothetical protein